MRRFLLVRTEDVSGISGTGIIVDGVQFDDGQCVLSWRGKFHSLEVHPAISQVVAIHGHEGRTRVEWLDPDTQ